jgi:hypothetical protein
MCNTGLESGLPSVLSPSCPIFEWGVVVCEALDTSRGSVNLLHLLLIRLCLQMAEPPQILHLLLTRLCSQMEPPPRE